MCLGNNLVDVARKFHAVVNVDTKIFDSSLLRNKKIQQDAGYLYYVCHNYRQVKVRGKYNW